MNRRAALALLTGTAVSACVPAPQQMMVRDGTGVPRAFLITGQDAAQVPLRALDAVNALRAAQGAGPVELDAQLTAAALTHSRDMALQNRPWLFGSDGSSPLDRARRAGFRGAFLSEAISESFETEIETITAWMQEPGPRSVILEPRATRMGFAFFQEPNGKTWWTLNMGA
jgi:uncharacterized protein YkwD